MPENYIRSSQAFFVRRVWNGKWKRFLNNEQIVPKKIKMFCELYKSHSLQQIAPVV